MIDILDTHQFGYYKLDVYTGGHIYDEEYFAIEYLSKITKKTKYLTEWSKILEAEFNFATLDEEVLNEEFIAEYTLWNAEDKHSRFFVNQYSNVFYPPEAFKNCVNEILEKRQKNLQN